MAEETTKEDHHAHHIALVVPAIGDNGVAVTDNRKLEDYKERYAASIRDPAAFWGTQATERLHWYHPFDQVLQGNFAQGDVAWFTGGKLNVCYNAVDRHCLSSPDGGDKVAMVWEGDEPDDIRRITFAQLRAKISQISHALQASNVQRGDVVTIYMPMSEFRNGSGYRVLYRASVVCVRAADRAGGPHKCLRACPNRQDRDRLLLRRRTYCSS